jgi:DNA-binding XRE family transcriptional regulator
MVKRYKPVPHSLAFRRKALAKPGVKAAYDALEEEFATLHALIEARKRAGLTQAEVARRMGVSQPVLARIESSVVSRKHSPSLTTLRRYAEACGRKLQIRLV